MRRLGYQPSGGIYRLLVGHIKRRGLDSSHFTGQTWARGRKFPDRRVLPLSEILVPSPYMNTARLRERLIKIGLKERRCEECGLQRWRGKDLPLALDHINGDHTDHRLANLRILCPNCHALTDTWCVRNLKPA
ncbi:MAG: HNH endonuclease [Pseudonocardiaceae bacterium]